MTYAPGYQRRQLLREEAYRLLQFDTETETIELLRQQQGITRQHARKIIRFVQKSLWRIAQCMEDCTVIEKPDTYRVVHGRQNRRVVRVEMFGQSLSIADWARRYHIDKNVVYDRLLLGWDFLRALETPARARKRLTVCGQTRTIEAWARRVGISEHSFRNRISRGWTGEKLIQPVYRGHLVNAFGRTQSIAAWAREKGININTLRSRLAILPPEQALIAPVMKRRTPNRTGSALVLILGEEK